MTFDPTTIRPLFPALAQEVAGRPAIFFDGPGGTQVPQMVIDAMSHYLAHDNANSHGAFATSRRTDATIAAAHAAMADLLGCEPDEIFFGQNMTSLTFALSRAIGRELQAGDEIIVTRLDHDANVAPWHALSERGVVIREVDIDPIDCTLDMDDMAAKIGPRTKLVAVGYASNAVGTINDVRQVVDWAHQVGALVFVDAVHYAPHGCIDVKALDCDFLACSVYKFFGPHVGAMYGKREHLQRLKPYKVRPADDTVPGRWMTGTQNHEGLAGVTAAVEYLASLGQPAPDRRTALVTAMERIVAYERSLAVQLIDGLLKIPGLTFYGIREPERFTWRTPTVSFRLAHLAPRAVAGQLAEHGIFVWDGNYYALSLSERLGVEPLGGMVRVGLVHYNTADEVDFFLTTLRKLATR
ncbi:MAG: cysteine desulfurase-like protein [Chloroflexus sp.]|uniref:cysteine desulfurase-like protein n=1 Tax=Chloroflexus sp. TaxID=1904827 RepID=UPI003C776EA0